MELSPIEKIVLEYIFVDQPNIEGIADSTIAFGRNFGHAWTSEEIHHALDSLSARQFILQVTPEIAASILHELREVHGPLVEVDTKWPHYSVTTAGGNVRFGYCPHSDGSELGGYGVTVLTHDQYFTPSEIAADILVATGIFSGKKLRVDNVYLAPNIENADGYLLDLCSAPRSNHPIRSQPENAAMIQQELQIFLEQQPQPLWEGLDINELWALLRRSGYAAGSAFHEVQEKSILSLLNKGLVRDLPREESKQQNQRLSDDALKFGLRPQYKMHVLSDLGREVLFRLFDSVPCLKEYCIVSRQVGKYLSRYFPNADQATAAQAKLRQEGMQASSVERIGKWCNYWWDVHPEGARISYWIGDNV